VRLGSRHPMSHISFMYSEGISEFELISCAVYFYASTEYPLCFEESHRLS
jgi:hypothetical protein